MGLANEVAGPVPAREVRHEAKPMSEEWAPFAVRREAPAWKVGYPWAGSSGPKRGEVKHSAEGFWHGLYSVLDGPAHSSWHFTVGYARIEQHYPVDAHCWHGNDVDDDGGLAANIDLVGVEHLGVVGQPLTEYQVEATIKITRWCAEQHGMSRFARYPTQGPGIWTLAEHKEVGDTPTACPSDRIPWDKILAGLEHGEELSVGQYEELKALIEGLKARIDFHDQVLQDLVKAVNEPTAPPGHRRSATGRLVHTRP